MTLIVTVNDLMTAKQCCKGGRAWFKSQGLDWQDFVQNGIDADILLAIDDVMAHQVVEVARGRSK